MNTSMFKKYSASALLLGTLVFSQSASASFVMMLDDPNDANSATYVYDNAVSDLNNNAGVITFSGTVGSFKINVTTGVSKPELAGGQLDLNSIDVSGTGGGTIRVAITDTDYNLSLGALTSSFGGTTQGNVKFKFLYDATNHEFGGSPFVAQDVGLGAFSNEVTVAESTNTAYSLTISTEITHAGGSKKTTSFDAAVMSTLSSDALTPVPAPAAIWLFMSALFSGFFVRRAKKSA